MNIVIYHDNCDDGFCAAWVMHKKLDSNIVLVPCRYGQRPPLPMINKRDDVWIVDFSFPKDDLDQIIAASRYTRLYDHHRTAFQALAGVDDPTPLEVWEDEGPAHRIVLNNDESGASLTWAEEFPTQMMPMLVRYVRDNDLWQHNLPYTRAFKHHLRLYPYNLTEWDKLERLLEKEYQREVFIQEGLLLEKAFDKYVQENARHAYPATIQGFDGVLLACNSPHAFASDLGHILAERAGGLGLVYTEGVDKMYVSLRATGDVDSSAVAKLYGGGGHKGASGFTCAFDARPWVRV
jgi:oligoribonuclease NrnB/cAMP/cGMP phosphodiesterase (DHH superfamily)